MTEDVHETFQAFADDIEKALGLSPELLVKLGSISAMAGTIEVHLEMSVWALGRSLPIHAPHRLDGRPASDWIKELDRLASERLTGEPREITKLWAAAAVPAFQCRHNILHGFAAPVEGRGIRFVRNPTIAGIKRKRECYATFADGFTMEKLRQVFATLMRTILVVRSLASIAADVAVVADAVKCRHALGRAAALADVLNDRLVGAGKSSKAAASAASASAPDRAST